MLAVPRGWEGIGEGRLLGEKKKKNIDQRYEIHGLKQKPKHWAKQWMGGAALAKSRG